MAPQWIVYLTYCVALVALLVVLAGTTFTEPASQRRLFRWLFAWSLWVGLVAALIIHILLE